MDQDETIAAMRVALRAGEVMLAASVAVSEVTETLHRITEALGVRGCQVAVTLDTITLSQVGSGAAVPITMMARLESVSPHLDRLAAVDALSRRIQAGEVGVIRADAELTEIAVRSPSIPGWVVFTAGVVTVAAWVVFAGGGPVAAAAGALGALAVAGLRRAVQCVRVPEVFTTVVSAMAVVAVPYALVWAGVEVEVQAAVAGALYPLLPGGLVVASVMDGLSGAPLSSLAKGLQAVVQAMAVAVGVLAALSVSELFEIVPSVPADRWPDVITMPAAGLALAGLAVSRLAPVRTVTAIAGLGMVTWWVASWGIEAELRRDLTTFAAAALLGLGGQLLARLLHTAASIFTTIAVYVLVPGVLMYLAMAAIATGGTDIGMQLLEQALRISVSIAAGVALGVGLGSAVRVPASVWRDRRGPMGRDRWRGGSR